MGARRPARLATLARLVGTGLVVLAVCPSLAAASSGSSSFVDDFNGPAGASPDPAAWTFDTGGNWGYGAQLQSYTDRAQNASQDGNGHLVITAAKETYTGPDGVTRQYTSARLHTWRKFEFTYGRIEARIQVPAGRGLWPGFWAFGDGAYTSNDWPASGEIDVMEFDGSQPDTLLGTLHGPRAGYPNGYALQGTFHSPTPLSAGFHTYAADWAPTGIRFELDGQPYATMTPSQLPPGATWPFDHPFFLALDLAIGDWVGPPDSTTPFPARMLVDWVRVSPADWPGPSTGDAAPAAPASSSSAPGHPVAPASPHPGDPPAHTGQLPRASTAHAAVERRRAARPRRARRGHGHASRRHKRPR
jgi:beta-glucanase (GH16 family)